jgi:hypothetical protein
VFAGLLGKPGFEPGDVRAEVVGRVEHGPPGTAPRCRGDGALALLASGELGWVAPVAGARQPSGDNAIALPDRLDGLVEAAWVSAWSLAEGELAVEYVAPPRADPVQGGGGPRILRIAGDPAALAGFVERAAHLLPGASRT